MSPVLLAGLCGAAPAPSLSFSTAFSCSFSLGEPSPGLAAAWGKGVLSHRGKKNGSEPPNFRRNSKFQLLSAPGVHFSVMLSRQLCPSWMQEHPAPPKIQLDVSQGGFQSRELSCSPRSWGAGTEEPPTGMSPRESVPAVPREGPWAPLGSTRAIRSQPVPGMDPPVEPPQSPDPVSFWKPRPKPVQRE